MDYKALAQMLMMGSPVQQAGGPSGTVRAKPMQPNWQLRFNNALNYGGDKDLVKVINDAAKAGITFGPEFDQYIK